MADKELWEKDRLSRRKEGFVRIDTSVTGQAMTSYDPSAQGFLPDADRFHSDTAGEERMLREDRAMRKRMAIDKKRFDSIQKDEARWRSVEQQHLQEQEKWDRHRVEGVKAQRNKGSVPFDPITLKYHTTEAGEALRQKDTRTLDRAKQRAVRLHQQSCRSGVNPITGAPLNER